VAVSDLVGQQQVFALNVAKLIQYAYEQGYAITLGEAYRSPEEARRLAILNKGISASLHCERLAVDLHLWHGGRFLTDSGEYRPLGVYWKSLHPENAWGGDFRDRYGRPKPDGNHFSMTWQGRK
jgi:hypothetical protein